MARAQDKTRIGRPEALPRRPQVRYELGYQQSPTTGRTLLTEVKECGGNGICKPPTHFQYKSDAPGFERIKTAIAAPTSTRASPMLVDINGDGLDDLMIPDTNPALILRLETVTGRAGGARRRGAT